MLAGWYYNNPEGEGMRIFRNGGAGARFMPRTMSSSEWEAAVEAGELRADKAPANADKDRAGPVAYGEGSTMSLTPHHSV
jgi:hypothetical protein